jgi:hypothetical protein
MSRKLYLYKAVVFAAAALALVSLTGCGSDSDSAKQGDPWAAEFEKTRESINDPVLLKILEDDEITDAEFAQVQQMVIDCDAEHGLRAWPDVDGGMRIEDTTNIPEDEFNKIMKDCEMNTYDVISPLYVETRQNPQNEDWSLMRLECLKKFQVVDESMTLDEFKQIDPNSPPWDPLSGDATGCIGKMAAYTGGQPDLMKPVQWPEGSHF